MKLVQWLPILIALKFMVFAQALTTESSMTTSHISSESSLEINGEDIEKDNDNEDDIIITNSGPVRGYTQPDTPNIKRFYDIPYGSFSSENPFEEPTPSEPWEEVHNASEHTSRCPQIEQPNKFVGNTKCLTLNIMVPTDATNADVLFHIHDGSFNHGSGNPSVYGPEYIVPKGIILVLPNYRLGPLGFLCMQNSTIPGNAALKDLTLALKWVKDNIAAFGGNPLNIAVSGESGAGALAGYLSVSPASSSYVSKVITESGFVLSHWAIDRDPISTVEILKKKLQTPVESVVTKSSKRNGNVMMYSDIHPLIKAAKDMKFAPCIENGNNSFITETPWNMLKNIKTNISFMIGSSNHAGMLEALQHTETSLNELNKDFGVILPNDLDFKGNHADRINIGNRIKNQYFGEKNVTLDTLESLSFCYTDASYLGPMIRAARPLVAAGAYVYFYEFAFVGAFNQEISASIKINGASKGDITRYIFCEKGREIPDEESKEKRMTNILTELWASFIHTGKPTSENIEWQRLEQTSESKENWLLIASEVTPQRGVHVDRLKIWKEIYETYFIERNRAFGVTPMYIHSYLRCFSSFVYRNF